MIDGPDIKSARERAGLSQQELAERLDVSLRTVGNWERGATVPRNREARIRDVLAAHFRGGAEPPEPVTADTLDARLANLDRQVDALWKRIEVLERRGDLSATADLTAEAAVVESGDDDEGGSVSAIRPDAGPPSPPDGAEAPIPDLQRRRESREAPPVPEDAAAHDPGVPSEYERRIQEQDESYGIDQDPR